MTIYFDMDGTIANLYGVENWLAKLINEDATPYTDATPLVRLSTLARLLNKAQRNGHKIGIVSWLAKNSTVEYDIKVTNAKIEWLNTHLKSVHFDEIKIGKYGTPKSTMVEDKNGILFDDEEPNRNEWKGVAHDVDNIIEILKDQRFRFTPELPVRDRTRPAGRAVPPCRKPRRIFRDAPVKIAAPFIQSAHLNIGIFREHFQIQLPVDDLRLMR